jgi:Fe-S-cluster containining protein
MTECNGCGDCCDPFQMIYSPASIKLGRVIGDTIGDRINDDELAFARAHLRPLSRAEGLRMVPWGKGGYSTFFVNGTWQFLAAWYYRCDLFDTATRRCTDYEHRPDCCRDYPWYGMAPDPSKVLPPRCSFNADVGRPVAPMHEVAVGPPVRRARKSARTGRRGGRVTPRNFPGISPV